MIPFESLSRVNAPWADELTEAFREVLASGRYVLGRNVEDFERRLADSLGVAHVVGVASGYDALTLALRGLQCRRGEVVVPSNTYAATILAVVRCGLTPVLAEPDPDSFLLGPEQAAKAVTPRTVALLPVHLFGLVCDLEALSKLAKGRGLLLVEDCAQAQGGSFRGRAAGAWGDAAALSFYPTKNLGALGDGGAVASASDAVAKRVRMLRNYGMRERAVAEEAGLNSRLDELQAAFLRAKLPGLPALVARKNALADLYDRELDPSVARPRAISGASPARSVYPILHPRRDALRAFLAGRGIGTEIHYPVPPHRQPALREVANGDFPVAERLHAQTLSLPLSAALSDEEAREVIGAVHDFLATGEGAA